MAEPEGTPYYKKFLPLEWLFVFATIASVLGTAALSLSEYHNLNPLKRTVSRSVHVLEFVPMIVLPLLGALFLALVPKWRVSITARRWIIVAVFLINCIVIAVLSHSVMKPVLVGAVPKGDRKSMLETGSSSDAVIMRSSIACSVAKMSDADFSTTVNDARVIPNYEDGKIQGFKIFAIKKGSVFDEIQLKNGDIVLAIDENPIFDVESSLQALAHLKERDLCGRQIPLELLRNEKHMRLVVHVK